MARRLLLGVSCVALCIGSAEARNKSGDNWYFGAHGGVTFVSGTPQPLSGGQINQLEGCATISDANGNLLFYTDGMSVWNNLHATMPNGTGLQGNPSATQSGVIVPSPAGGGIYYVFTVPATGSGSVGLRYSVVDMSLDSGKGSVVSGSKNTQLMANCSEQVTGVAHANGHDIWVVARKMASNEFDAFLVTNSGINTTAVTSSAGTATSSGGEIGYLKTTSSGDRLGMSYYFLGTAEVYDFDTSTGAVSNAVNLGASMSSAYGFEFSQDGSRAYVARYSSAIYQFDLTEGSVSDSKYTVVGAGANGAIQLGPDGKIYISVSNTASLSVINSPNLVGAACDYQAAAVAISGTCQAGLPTFIQSFFAASAAYTTTQDVPLSIATSDFTTAYQGAIQSTLEFIRVTGLPTHGTLTIGGNAAVQNAEVAAADLTNVTYTPAPSFYGSDQFAWGGAHTTGTYDFTATFTIGITQAPDPPTVTTTAVSTIASTTAISGGDVTDTGGTSVTARGVCWSTSADPTTADSKTDDGTGTGEFTSSITGLTPGTAYYVRAYATNDAGAAYGDSVQFTTTALYSVTFIAGEHGSLVGTTAQSVEAGAGCTAVEALADDGFTFTGWSGDYTGTENPLTVSDVSADKTITASFTAVPVTPQVAPDLYVTIAPENGGTGNDVSLQVGGTASFIVTVGNNGDGDATNVVVTVPLPDTVEFVSAEILTGATGQTVPNSVVLDGNLLTITIAQLTTGGSVDVRLTLRAKASGSVLLTAQVQSAEQVAAAVAPQPVSLTTQDDYYQIVTTGGCPCGAAGAVPLAMTACGLALIRRRQVTR